MTSSSMATCFVKPLKSANRFQSERIANPLVPFYSSSSQSYVSVVGLTLCIASSSVRLMTAKTTRARKAKTVVRSARRVVRKPGARARKVAA